MRPGCQEKAEEQAAPDIGTPMCNSKVQKKLIVNEDTTHFENSFIFNKKTKMFHNVNQSQSCCPVLANNICWHPQKKNTWPSVKSDLINCLLEIAAPGACRGMETKKQGVLGDVIDQIWTWLYLVNDVTGDPMWHHWPNFDMWINYKQCYLVYLAPWFTFVCHLDIWLLVTVCSRVELNVSV